MVYIYVPLFLSQYHIKISRTMRPITDQLTQNGGRSATHNSNEYYAQDTQEKIVENRMYEK